MNRNPVGLDPRKSYVFRAGSDFEDYERIMGLGLFAHEEGVHRDEAQEYMAKGPLVFETIREDERVDWQNLLFRSRTHVVKRILFAFAEEAWRLGWRPKGYDDEHPR